MTKVKISDISADERFQARVVLNHATVEDYAEAMDSGAKLPPIECVRIDGALHVVDGFHRLAAHIRRGEDRIEANVVDGTVEHALAAASSANIAHGLRRTNEDKLRSVRMYLTAHPSASDRKAATHCGVSHPTVAKVRHEMSVEEAVKAGATDVAPKKKAPKERSASGKDYHPEPAQEEADFSGACPTCGR